jgi:hypothetical protein
MLITDGAVGTGPKSLKVVPLSVETATPLKPWPPSPKTKSGVSKKLPESLKPTTTLLPHRAVEVSLWVNPAKEEYARSVDGSETAATPVNSDAVAGNSVEEPPPNKLKRV